MDRGILDQHDSPRDVVETPEVADIEEIQEALDQSPPVSNYDYAIETSEQVEEAVDALIQIEGIRPENWQTMEASERLQVLQQVENHMAEIQERNPVSIQVELMQPNLFGSYDQTNQFIRLNTDHLESDMPVQEFVDTIVHEGRHAYQNFIINNPELISDQTVVTAWAENMNDYLSVELYGQEEYLNQPVEADAWSYAERIRSGIYGK